TQEGSKPHHQLDFGHVHEVPHTRQDWVFNKLLRPRMWDEGKEAAKDYNELLKMPNFGMSEREATAVLANVMGFTKESALATRRAGGDARTASLAPNLAAEGARVQGNWLFSYLHDPSRVKMRPWLTVRMPTFGFTDDQANTVISYFEAREQSRPFLSEPPAPDPKSLAVGGVVFTMFQCARCHPTAPVSAQAASGDLAPSLLLAHDRLRYDWVPQWIQDPQSWVPGTRMPQFPLSAVSQMLTAPANAAYKQQLLRYFSSEAEMNAYFADAGKVAVALRDHVWAISGGRRPAAAESSGAAVGAGGAGGR